AQSRARAVYRRHRAAATSREAAAAPAPADELRAETGHAKRLAGAGPSPDRIQRASRETERFVGVAARLGRTRPSIENHAQKLRSALFGELPRFLERAAGGRTIRLHPELSGKHQHADLGVDLTNLARELESGLRSFEGLGDVTFGEDLRLGRSYRRERALSLCLFGQTGRAGETFSGAREVAVLDVESRGVVEGARHLIKKPELLVNIEALLARHDRGFDVTDVVVRLRHTGAQQHGGRHGA